MDIAEAGGLSKDGSPRPSKSQQGHAEQPGAQAHPGAMRQVGLDIVTNSRSEQTSDLYSPAVRFIKGTLNKINSTEENRYN